MQCLLNILSSLLARSNIHRDIYCLHFVLVRFLLHLSTKIALLVRTEPKNRCFTLKPVENPMRRGCKHEVLLKNKVADIQIKTIKMVLTVEQSCCQEKSRCHPTIVSTNFDLDN